MDYTDKIRKPLTSFYLTQNVPVTKWTMDEANEHMINETMLFTTRHITLKTKKKNLVTNWEDAIWQYDLHYPIPTTCFITWTPLIKYKDIYTIKKYSQIRWSLMLESLDKQWPLDNSDTSTW